MHLFDCSNCFQGVLSLLHYVTKKTTIACSREKTDLSWQIGPITEMGIQFALEMLLWFSESVCFFRSLNRFLPHYVRCN